MVSTGRTARRTMLRRPLVCKTKKPPPNPPPTGYYSLDVHADASYVYVDQGNTIEIHPETDQYPPGSEVILDYFPSRGEIDGPATMPSDGYINPWWGDSGQPGNVDVYVRATFPNGAVAWGHDAFSVEPY